LILNQNSKTEYQKMDTTSRYKALAKTSIQTLEDYSQKITDLTTKFKTKEYTEAEYMTLLNSTITEMQIVQQALKRELYKKVIISVKL
jgi:hypothetical protein